MRYIRDNGGFSIVEILVCMVLIGLIVVFILPSITFGYLQISESGGRTRAVYTARKVAENELANRENSGSDTLSITFGDGSDRVTINVRGRIVETEESFGAHGDKAKIRLFVPNK